MSDDCSVDPIAIIGRGCHLPRAANIAEYLQLILNDQPTIAEIPAERFDRGMFYDKEPGKDFKTYCSKACLVEPVPESKLRSLPTNWRSHPETALRDLLSVVRDACLDAGKPLEALSGERGGVYLGHTRGGSLAGDLAYSTYVAQAAALLEELPQRFPEIDPSTAKRWSEQLIAEVREAMPNFGDQAGPPLGAPVAAMAALQMLGWDGPFAAFNGACASSLQALHAAVLALQSGRLNIAVAAGLSCYHSDSLLLFSQARSLSGVDTRPFDDQADGLIIGEGAVVLILKRLSDAIRDADPIHAVIRGISVASDGKGKSLWAPRKEGQILAIRRAYTDDSMMRKIQYVEAHATSTQVGDATEMEALATAFGPIVPQGTRLPVGSVKAIVGHTLESAGLAGLLKVILCMEKEIVPAHQRLEKLSTKIPWNDIPFFVPNQTQPWLPDELGCRWAAVNGFGIGGLNAHAVVQSGTIVEAQPLNDRRSTRTADHQTFDQANRQVAIIGAGCILPGALSWTEFKSRNWSQEAIQTVPPRRWVSGPERDLTFVSRVASTQGGFIDNFEYDWRRHKVQPKQIKGASPLQFMILEAVDQAIRPSGILEDPDRRERTGVVVGTIFGGDFSNQLQVGLRIPDMCRRLRSLWEQNGLSESQIEILVATFRSLTLDRMPAFFDETGSFTSSSLASRITKSFDLMGGAVAVDAAHGASGAALSYCMDQLASGMVDYMVCVGAQQDMGPMKFEGWTANGWLPDEHGKQGVAPGEGAAVILLEAVPPGRDAIRTPLGWIRGVGHSYAKNGGVSLRRSIERAFDAAHRNRLEHSDYQPAVDGSIRTHRWSPMGVPAIDNPCHFGLQLATGTVPERSTFVDSVGHLTGGSGIVEFLASLAWQAQQTALNENDLRLQDIPGSECINIGSPWECIYSVILDVMTVSNVQT
jgi:acyl transferase domain-containing protein